MAPPFVVTCASSSSSPWDGVSTDLTMVGPLYHALFLAAVTSILFVVDAILKRAVVVDVKARWFLLHAIGNGVVCLAGVPDMVAVLANPFCALAGPLLSWTPCHIALGLHLYHLIAFTTRLDDVVHHVVFCGVFGTLTLTQTYGPVMNLLLFFITGLPGGITYFLLFLVGTGRFEKLEEKRLSSYINVWLRTPGLVFTASIMIGATVHGFIHVPVWSITLVICLVMANGIYYGAGALENWVENRSSTAGGGASNKKGGAAGEGGEKETPSSADKHSTVAAAVGGGGAPHKKNK